MARSFVAFSVAAIAACLATQAAAQSAGTYTGTDASGDALSITLGTDTNTGKLAILADSVNLPAAPNCKPATTESPEGYSTGFLQDLTGNKATLTFSVPQIYTVTTMTFSGDQVTGTITTDEPIFVNVASGAPRKASFCSIPKQSYTLTLGAALPAGAKIAARQMRF